MNSSSNTTSTNQTEQGCHQPSQYYPWLWQQTLMNQQQCLWQMQYQSQQMQMQQYQLQQQRLIQQQHHQQQSLQCHQQEILSTLLHSKVTATAPQANIPKKTQSKPKAKVFIPSVECLCRMNKCKLAEYKKMEITEEGIDNFIYLSQDAMQKMADALNVQPFGLDRTRPAIRMDHFHPEDRKYIRGQRKSSSITRFYKDGSFLLPTYTLEQREEERNALKMILNHDQQSFKSILNKVQGRTDEVVSLRELKDLAGALYKKTQGK